MPAPRVCVRPGVLQPTLLATRQLATSACGYIDISATAVSDVQYFTLPPAFTGVIPPNASIPGDLGTNYQHVVNDPSLTYFNGSIYAPCPYAYQMVLVDAQSLVVTLPPIGQYRASRPPSPPASRSACTVSPTIVSPPVFRWRVQHLGARVGHAHRARVHGRFKPLLRRLPPIHGAADPWQRHDQPELESRLLERSGHPRECVDAGRHSRGGLLPSGAAGRRVPRPQGAPIRSVWLEW
jgi:hypothetical protein